MEWPDSNETERHNLLHATLTVFTIVKLHNSDRYPRQAVKCMIWLTRVLALLIVAGGLAAIASCSRSDKAETDRYTVLGQEAASATADLLNSRGRIVIVVAEKDFNSGTALGVALKSFNEALAKSGNVQVQATETVKVPTLLVSGTEPLAAPQFLELVTKYASADALVSFVGVPRLTASQIAQLPRQRPKLVVVAVFGPLSKTLFEQGIVQLAILPKSLSEPAVRPPGTAKERFDAYYQIVTPETSSTLPY